MQDLSLSTHSTGDDGRRWLLKLKVWLLRMVAIRGLAGALVYVPR